VKKVGVYREKMNSLVTIALVFEIFQAVDSKSMVRVTNSKLICTDCSNEHFFDFWQDCLLRLAGITTGSKKSKKTFNLK